jgi:carbon storage regulator
MLVIRRRPGEALFIGDDVEIEILDCSPSHVKLGIRAPKEITVLRKEIHITSQQNAAAARAASPETVRRILGSLR